MWFGDSQKYELGLHYTEEHWRGTTSYIHYMQCVQLNPVFNVNC